MLYGQRIKHILVFIPYVIVFGIASIFLSTASFVFGSLLPENKRKYARILGRLWGKIGIWSTFSRVHIEGRENKIPPGSLIAVNHQSFVDIFCLLGWLPCDFLFISKKEVFDAPFIGWGMRGLGFLSLNRESPREAAKTTLEAISKLQQGYNLLIFPEATYAENPEKMLEFKAGVAMIAAKSRAPVVPVVLYGSKELIDPDRSFYQINPRKLDLRILPAIDVSQPEHPAANTSKDHQHFFLVKLRETMQKNYLEMKIATQSPWPSLPAENSRNNIKGKP